MAGRKMVTVGDDRCGDNAGTQADHIGCCLHLELFGNLFNNILDSPSTLALDLMRQMWHSRHVMEKDSDCKWEGFAGWCSSARRLAGCTASNLFSIHVEPGSSSRRRALIFGLPHLMVPLHSSRCTS